MLSLNFPEADLDTIRHERYHHPHPMVQRKMEVLWLKSLGYPHADIARIAGVCPNTARAYLREYRDGGIERVKEVRLYRPQSDLVAHQSSLEDHFRQHPPATIKEAQHVIEASTGVKRQGTQVRAFLKRIGMQRRKVGTVPAKADPAAQAAYLEAEMQPRLEQAKAGQRAVFFVDAAHFVLSPFLGFLWSFARVFVPSAAGRQRFNVLGALNGITHDLILVTNTTYINAESMCQLLWKLAALNLDVPITLFLDNARYQRCALVQTCAASLHIELCFLPAYSPNLNLIERLWKFVKKQCLYSKYYADFASFQQAIVNCLEQTQTTYKSALDSLMTLKFHLFEQPEKAQSMAA